MSKQIIPREIQDKLDQAGIRLAVGDQFILLANEMAISEADIWQAVAWWKHKNIWQRPLAEDDAKAWRMIKKRLTAV